MARLWEVRTGIILMALAQLAVAAEKDSLGLVDKLATTNPPATIRGEPGDERASWRKLNSKESKRVDALLKQVIERSEDLLPELVAHLGDERYCKTVGMAAGYPSNWSVGDICQQIIGETLSEPYYRHLPGTKTNYHRFRLPAFAQDKAKLREWCLARKDRKLYELQIEACEWALGELKGSNEELVTAIKQETESLKKTKTAVPSNIAF